MNRLELQRKLNEKAVWNTTELTVILGKNRSIAKVYADRLKKAGILRPLARGWYASSPNIFAIATSIKNNSYFSFLGIF